MKEEKLKEAKRLYESANADQKYVLESLFPELKEINEEEIKKAMINFFKSERKEGDVVLHYGVNIESMIAWLEKQGEQKPIEWDADDDEKFFFLKARLKDYEDCIIYDEELSMCQKNNVRETTKEFLEWLDSIKERIGG